MKEHDKIKKEMENLALRDYQYDKEKLEKYKLRIVEQINSGEIKENTKLDEHLIVEDDYKEDIRFLIHQLYTIEHMQDSTKIKEIAEKYKCYPL